MGNEVNIGFAIVFFLVLTIIFNSLSLSLKHALKGLTICILLFIFLALGNMSNIEEYLLLRVSAWDTGHLALTYGASAALLLRLLILAKKITLNDRYWPKADNLNKNRIGCIVPDGPHIRTSMCSLIGR